MLSLYIMKSNLKYANTYNVLKLYTEHKFFNKYSVI